MKNRPRSVLILLLVLTACGNNSGCEDEEETPSPAAQVSATPTSTDECIPKRLIPAYLPQGATQDEREPYASADDAQSWTVGNGWVQVLAGVNTEWEFAQSSDKQARGKPAKFGPVGHDDGRTVFVLAWTEPTPCGAREYAVVGALLRPEDFTKIADSLAPGAGD